MSYGDQTSRVMVTKTKFSTEKINIFENKIHIQCNHQSLAYLNRRNSMYFFLWGKVSNKFLHWRVMPLIIGVVWKTLVENDSRRAKLVDTLCSFSWMLFLFCNFQVLCYHFSLFHCPLSPSHSPLALCLDLKTVG